MSEPTICAECKSGIWIAGYWYCAAVQEQARTDYVTGESHPPHPKLCHTVNTAGGCPHWEAK